VPWPNYYGYASAEGQELNETARLTGDEPDDWHVSEQPVDVLKVSEFMVKPDEREAFARRMRLPIQS
jgi:hypothetical protein